MRFLLPSPTKGWKRLARGGGGGGGGKARRRRRSQGASAVLAIWPRRYLIWPPSVAVRCRGLPSTLGRLFVCVAAALSAPSIDSVSISLSLPPPGLPRSICGGVYVLAPASVDIKL
ncbi:unnamed protein product [Pleuronectes platessa]|uniref:Uncharacterized protein n=1 Tax=Pleuronectes platessa TaxID=8262 RepID=A0A9N7VUJ8_PLEPL|nr:unnamed protein product [Pleuronectes platessa]